MFIGDGVHEPWTELAPDPADNERVREGERYNGHERGDDVRCR